MGRRGRLLPAAVWAVAVGGGLAAQPPADPPPAPSPLPFPAKLPDAVPETRLPDYFGPSTGRPFTEKTLFPEPALPNRPPPAQVPDGLPPAPPVGRPVLIPDGALPLEPPPPPRLWRGGIEFGINGSQGNTDVLGIRLGANADRKVENNLFHVNFLYAISRQDGVTEQNQGFLNARDEILFPGSRWSVFSATQVEYDEFRAYDVQVGSYLGLSYRWLRSETTLLKSRFGAGAVRQVDTTPEERGGAPDRWVPEAVFGGDFNHRFSDRQGFLSSVDVFPNLSQIGQFRVRARAGYEIVLAPEYGMVLRLGVQERYDSSPGNARRNDLNYFTTLLFKF